MGNILKYRGWNLLNAGYFSPGILRELFDCVHSGVLTGEYLKNHHRSIVRRFTFQDTHFVLKIPSEKNSRPWIRFTTLYRNGEAFRNIRGMQVLASLGVPSTKPVMAAEKRESGMVVDSWLIYEFLEGTSCRGKDQYFPHVVDRLSGMHDLGILHGDSQIQNFIYADHQAHVIDSNPRPIQNQYQVAFEYAYLHQSSPEIEACFGSMRTSPWYRAAKSMLAFDRRMATAKRRIKRLFGFKLREG